MKVATTPMPHQRECVNLITQFNGRAIIADEQGLGKTFESLLWTAENKAWRCIITCPATLKYNWHQEIREHLKCSSLVLEGRIGYVRRTIRGKVHKRKMNKQERSDTLKELKRYRYIIVNFAILESWLPFLRKLKAKTVINDECQSICNRTSQQYHNFAELVRGVPNLLSLSGTPITNRPAEFWPVLNFTRPDVWPSFFTFAIDHCEPKRNQRGELEYKGARKLDVLHAKAKEHCMIRRLKDDVLDLPAKTRMVIPLPSTTTAEYQRAERDVKTWLQKEKGLSTLMKSKKNLNMVKFNHFRQLAIQGKIKSIIEWTERFLEDTGEKLVLMFCHTDPLEQTLAHFGHIAVRVDGRVTSKLKRQEAISSFQLNDRKRLFLGNMKAAGVGVTLTAAAHLALAELPWTPTEIRQVEDRIHRISQERKTFIYLLVSHGSVEEKVARKLTEKDNVVNEVIDGGRNDSLDVSGLIKKSKAPITREEELDLEKVKSMLQKKQRKWKVKKSK